MIRVTLPPSDVTGSGTPYRAAIEIPVEDARAQARIRVEIRRAEPGLEAPKLSASLVAVPESEVADEARRFTIEINADTLAEGEYNGELIVDVDGKPAISREFAFFRMPEPRLNTRPFGVYAMRTPPMPEMDIMIDGIASMGFNVLSPHAFGTDSSYLRLADRGARAGMTMQPCLRHWEAPRRPPATPEEAAVDATGAAPIVNYTCYNREAARERSAMYLERYLSQHIEHPAFGGKIYFGDDFFLWPGKQGISCYCEACLDGFKKQTGLEPARATPQKTGIVAHDDPWLQWMRYRSEIVYAGFLRAIEAAKDRVDASVEIGLAHGFPDNPFTSISTGIYGPLTQLGAVVSSYCYPFLRCPAGDLVTHYEIGRMGNRDKPVWMLGNLAADNTLVPGWQVRQNYWNMLAAGYDLIAFFSWYDVRLSYISDSEVTPAYRARRDETLAALAACGAHKDWILPGRLHWRRAPARAALLFSFTTESFEVVSDYTFNRHSKRICAFHREALRRHVPLEIVAEEEIRDGLLDRYDTLCLHDVRTLPDDVAAIIRQFAAGGGAVLTSGPILGDDFPVMTPEAMADSLAERSERPVTASNPDVTVRMFNSGDIIYAVLVNNAPDKYHKGYQYDYGNPERNYRHAEAVRDEPVAAEIMFDEPGLRLFDMDTGAALGSSDNPLSVEIGPSWGNVVAAMKTDKAQLQVETPETAQTGDRIVVPLNMLDAAGEPLKGAFTVKVSVTTPSGRNSRYSDFASLGDGRGEFILPLGTNDETGEWMLTFEGGFPRATISRALTVEQADAPVLQLRAIRPGNRDQY